MYKHCLGEVLCTLPMVQKVIAASQCTCETTDDATSKYCSLQCVTTWWSGQLHKYPDYLSNSLKRKTSDSSSKLSNSSGVKKTKFVTDQTLWHWATRLLRAESYGISDRCSTTREKSWDIQAGSQCPRPKYLCSSLKACHMAFCCCFQPPSTAFSTADRVSGKSSWISCKEGKPWVYHFLLFIPTRLQQEFKHILYIALWLISRQK